jgi:hypothetical protein
MGSTRIDFRGKGFEASDFAIEIWLALMVREIDALAKAPEWLREVRDDWETQATGGFGYGVMPELDRFVTDDARRDLLIALGRRALIHLAGLGDVIPRDVLNAFQTGGQGTTFTGDVSSAPFRRTGEYFLKLLEDTLTPAESDARFPPPASRQD